MNYTNLIQRFSKLPRVYDYIILSSPVPYYLSNAKDYRVCRYGKWRKLPPTAWKLYWRMHK